MKEVSIRVVCLDAIRPGAVVRLHPTLHTMAVFDLMKAHSDKEDKARSKEWAKWKEHPEIKPHLSEYQFPGVAQRYQPMIDFEGSLILVMRLGGEFAAQSRVKMSRILQGVIAGDPGVLKAVEANARSDDPLCRMARASLASSPPNGAGIDDEGGKVGSKRSLVDTEVGMLYDAMDIAHEGAVVLVKRLKEASQTVVDTSSQMEKLQPIATGMCHLVEKLRLDADGLALAFEASAVSMEKLVKHRQSFWAVEKEGVESLAEISASVASEKAQAEAGARAKELADSSAARAKEMEDGKAKALADAAARAKELEDGKAKALADAEARAKELEDLAARNAKELEDLSARNASELAFIVSRANAVDILTEAKKRSAKELLAAPLPVAAPPPAPPLVAAPLVVGDRYPNVVAFMPADHTTVEEAYKSHKDLQVILKNRVNHLNEARKETRALYQAEFSAPPRQVGSGGRLEDMYPRSWGGLMDVLRSLKRSKTVGQGQSPITNFIVRGGNVHVHVHGN